MSETDVVAGAGPEGEQRMPPIKGRAGMPIAIYALYLASFFVGITSIIAVILAYTSREREDYGLYTHYTFQIYTFWLGLLYSVGFGIAAAILMLLAASLGMFAMALMAVAGIALFAWFLLRCCTGLVMAIKGEPIANPESWGFVASRT
ncbi:DUF4870 family protein [Nisaea sediminum]|uniref:DUF4870 family protein n=1 Tax=Nisaea sediminum TaxID=2775867 RepID=UPI001D02546F|nr:hypothetical protein [Nisaea sediminum]